jgi:hypothetical protein
MTDLLRFERIADVNGSDSGVKVGNKYHPLIVNRREVFIRGMRAEVPAAATEVITFLGYHPSGYPEWPRLHCDLESTHDLACSCPFVGDGFAGHYEKVAQFLGV